MRLTFRDADFETLTEVWNNFYPPEFRIDPQILRQNTVDNPAFDWGASQIEVMDDTVMGFVALTQSSAKLYPGSPMDTAHLSAIAYTQAETGIDLLAESKNILRNRGVNKLQFGMDSRHFFPGCPDTAQSLCSLLMVEGFDNGGDCFDVERDLQDYEAPFPISEAATYRPLKEEDKDSLDNLMPEFSNRWRYDVFNKMEVEDRTDFVIGAFQGEECVGFALTQDPTHKLPISGATWRKDLGENWGALGPIGVAKSERGKGIGHGLLSSALIDLKSRGTKRTIIDWTVLVDFYGKHGFKTARTYQAKSLRLGD